MTQPKIWHNPRCSKSRQTLAILEDEGFQPEVLEYLKTAPSEQDLRAALGSLAIAPSDLIRKGEAVYKELGLKDADDDTLIKAMVANPILIERPVVFHKGKVALGRPPESVKAIL